MSRQQSSRQFTLRLVVYCQFRVLGVSISKHQFLIWPLFSCSPWIHYQLLSQHAEKICSWLCLPHAHMLQRPAKSAVCLSCCACIRNTIRNKFCRSSTARGNHLDVLWGPLGCCRDLWEDDLISDFLLSCLPGLWDLCSYKHRSRWKDCDRMSRPGSIWNSITGDQAPALMDLLWIDSGEWQQPWDHLYECNISHTFTS